MSDANPQQEPSMEEILASIRRIISEDDAPDDGEESSAEEAPAEEAPAEEASEEASEDVLELTEVAEETEDEPAEESAPVEEAAEEAAEEELSIDDLYDEDVDNYPEYDEDELDLADTQEIPVQDDGASADFAGAIGAAVLDSAMFPENDENGTIFYAEDNKTVDDWVRMQRAGLIKGDINRSSRRLIAEERSLPWIGPGNWKSVVEQSLNQRAQNTNSLRRIRSVKGAYIPEAVLVDDQGLVLDKFIALKDKPELWEQYTKEDAYYRSIIEFYNIDEDVDHSKEEELFRDPKW